MKKLTLTLLAAALTILLSAVSVVSANQGNGNQYGNNMPNVNSVQSCTQLTNISAETDLSTQEQNDLIFMREEEKLARDVYLQLYRQWNLNIFNNIATSEQNHTDSVKAVLDAYNIADTASSSEGVFNNSSLQALFDQLMSRGSISLVDALEVGILIEETDIQDLLNTMNNTTNAQILQMYTNLLNGSYNHLRAFVRQLNQQGISYTPGIITREQADIILSLTNNVSQGSTLSTDSLGNTIQSDSCIYTSIRSTSGLYSQSGITFANAGNISINTTLIPDASTIGQNAHFVALLNYTSTDGSQILVMRSGDGWTILNQQSSQLSYAMQQILQTMNQYQILNADLTALPGQYKIYSGYQLQDGTLVYAAESFDFNIE